MSQHEPQLRTQNRGSTDGDGPTRSVVIPVYAEEPAVVTGLVDDLLRAGWHQVVVCADEPSADLQSTLETIDGDPHATLSVSETRRGKGGAIAAGLDLATGDVVGYVDADGAISVRELRCVYRLVERGDADLAIGSRGVPGNGRAGQSFLRRTLAGSYRWLARQVTGVPVQDFQCGAKALTREAWSSVAADVNEREFAFDTELIARVYHQGFRIREVSIDWADPGDSDVRLRRDVPGMLSSLVRIRRTLTESARRRRTAGDVLRVALVSSHPPNRGHLAEYGEQLARAYAAHDDVEVTVLALETPGAPPDERRDGYTVRRVWQRDSFRGALALFREVRTGDYDVVQFNIHVTYFGTRNVYRFVGLALPPLFSLLFGVQVVTTMHDLLEVVEEDVVEERVGRLERFGAYVATQLVLLSDATTVTSAEYLDVVERRYRAREVHHVPHGTFGRATDGGVTLDPPLRVLVFGHLSPTKDIDTVVAAFETVRERVPDAELWIAGGSHPGHPDHRQVLEDQHGDEPGVRFTGYLEDDEMDDVWLDSSLVVMPYRTCTGVSGVFQLAKSYGRPVVAFDTPGMHTATVDTGGVAEFVPPGDAEELATRITDLWTDRERLRRHARTNADAAEEYTIGDTADRMIEILRGVVG